MIIDVVKTMVYVNMVSVVVSMDIVALLLNTVLFLKDVNQNLGNVSMTNTMVNVVRVMVDILKGIAVVNMVTVEKHRIIVPYPRDVSLPMVNAKMI